MKKLFKSILIISLTLLLLTSCKGDSSTSVSNKDEVIVKIKDTTITKNDIYKYAKLNFGFNVLTVNLVNMMLEEYVELSDEELKEAQAGFEDMKEMFDEDFEQMVISAGYKSLDEYFENFVLREVKIQKLFDKHIDENIEQIVKNLSSKKVRIFEVKDKAIAEAVLAEMQEAENLTIDTFLEIANKHHKDEDSVAAPLTIEHVYENRSENKHLNTFLKDNKTGLHADVILTDKETFQVIYIDNLDLEADIDMFKSSIVNNDAVYELIFKATMSHYSKEGNFKIHDIDLHKLFKENNPFE